MYKRVYCITTKLIGDPVLEDRCFLPSSYGKKNVFLNHENNVLSTSENILKQARKGFRLQVRRL